MSIQPLYPTLWRVIHNLTTKLYMLACLAEQGGGQTESTQPRGTTMLTVRQIHNRVIGALIAIAVLGAIGIIAEVSQTRVDVATQEDR